MVGVQRMHGRARDLQAAAVGSLLADIEKHYGGYSLHRLVRLASGAGPYYLEREGMRAMLAREDDAVEEVCGSAAAPREPGEPNHGEIAMVIVNVDGVGAYDLQPADRMEEILTAVLAVTPDLILMQEVVAEMLPVLKRRLPDWKIHRRRDVTEEYFNITAMSEALHPEAGRTSSYPFSCSRNGRHLLTVRPPGWSIINVHAESGRGVLARDCREKQLHHMSRMQECEAGRACVLAGDMNIRSGEEHPLESEGWRDVGLVGDSDWTWQRAQNNAKYDRIFVHGVAIECGPAQRLTSIWPSLSDHVALHVLLRRKITDPPAEEDLHMDSAPGQSSQIQSATGQTSQAQGRTGAPAGSEAGGPRGALQVVKVANAALLFVHRFRAQAEASLQYLDDDTWTPEQTVGLPDAAGLVAWTDVPTLGGFKTGKVGPRGTNRRASLDDQLHQRNRYHQYKHWAEVACGVSDAELKGYLATAANLFRHARGLKGLPNTLQHSRHDGDITIATHALLLCRVHGLRRAIMQADVEELGEPVWRLKASTELERLLNLDAKHLRSECEALPKNLLEMRSLHLKASCDTPASQSSLVVGLFTLWVFEEAANMLKAQEAWQELLRLAPREDTAVVAPTYFVMDDATFDAAVAQELVAPHCSRRSKDTSKLKLRNPLLRAWWSFAWEAACAEVSHRFGPERRTCKQELEVSFTMEELYRKLFSATNCEEAPYPKSAERERELKAIWGDLSFFERKAGRKICGDELGRFYLHPLDERSDKFDRKTLSAVWRHASTAWGDGWPYGAGSGVGAQTSGQDGTATGICEDEETIAITDIPKHEVKTLPHDTYSWRQFKTITAQGADEAYDLLNANWKELQEQTALAKRMGKRFKEKLFRHLPGDTARRSVSVISLQHSAHKEIFHGRLFEEGQKLVFEEQNTGFRVQVDKPSHLSGRALQNWREQAWYEALRFKHAAAKKAATKSARKALAESRNGCLSCPS